MRCWPRTVNGSRQHAGGVRENVVMRQLAAAMLAAACLIAGCSPALGQDPGPGRLLPWLAGPAP
jgi:hypothetical protein